MSERTSSRIGTANSIAWLGVEARTSATTSLTSKSDSCPTAEITGIGIVESARATGSRLNAHKSSGDPPPRPTMTTSTGGIPSCSACSLRLSDLAAASPRVISSTALSP